MGCLPHSLLAHSSIHGDGVLSDVPMTNLQHDIWYVQNVLTEAPCRYMRKKTHYAICVQSHCYPQYSRPALKRYRTHMVDRVSLYNMLHGAYITMITGAMHHYRKCWGLLRRLPIWTLSIKQPI